MYRALPHSVLALLIDRGGAVRAADLDAIGIGRRGLATLLGRRLLVAVSRGVYTAAGLRDLLDPWAWFALRSRALTVASADDAVAAGWSAVALLDLPHFGRPPEWPCVIRRACPPRGSDLSLGGRTRFASIDPEWAQTVAGVPTLHPAVTVIDVARRSGRLAALVLADAVARLPGGHDSMRSALDRLRHWPGAGRSGWAVAHADGDCESPLETVGRYALLGADIPPPLSNVWVGLERPRYRLDHYWPEQRVALEGDGVHKYRMAGVERLVTVDEALVAEKDREFETRGWGVTTERYTWRRALREPGTLAGRCSAVLAGPRPPAHPGLRWWPTEEGYRLVGMRVPHTQLGAGPGWRRRVEDALRRLAR